MIYNLFSSLFFIIFAIIAIIFSVSNAQIVQISLDPLPFGVSLPLYLAIQITAFFSFVLGAICAYIFNLKYHQLLRAKNKYIEELERQINSKVE
jgi:hypothetical protein